MRKALGFLAVAGLLCAAPAVAATITETASFGPTAIPFSNQPLSIAQFNPALGTLNSVDFIVSAFTSGTATITNKSPNDGTYTNTTVTTTMSLFDPNGNFLVSAAPEFVFASLFVPAGATRTTGSVTGSPVTNSFLITTGLGTYEGLGLTNFTLSGAAEAQVSGPTPYSVSESATGTGTVKLVYNYTAAPEPSTISMAILAGFGFLGLAWRRRRA